MAKEKVAIIGTNGLPAKYGGFETLTHYLTLNLNEEFDFRVYCSKTPKRERIRCINKAELIYFPLRANGWQSVLFDISTIIHAWFSSDKLLILGSSGALILPLKIFFRKRVILNIGGIDWGGVNGHILLRNSYNYPKKFASNSRMSLLQIMLIFKNFIKNIMMLTVQ